MLKNIIGDLRTTLAGIGLGIAQIILNGRSGKAFAGAVATVILGALSKL